MLLFDYSSKQNVKPDKILWRLTPTAFTPVLQWEAESVTSQFVCCRFDSSASALAIFPMVFLYYYSIKTEAVLFLVFSLGFFLAQLNSHNSHCRISCFPLLCSDALGKKKSIKNDVRSTKLMQSLCIQDISSFSEELFMLLPLYMWSPL